VNDNFEFPDLLGAAYETIEYMSSYNTLETEFKCPRCGTLSEMEIDLYFGFRSQIVYHLGDTVKWLNLTSVKDGGRPENGNGEGYGECSICMKDFFTLVTVRGDFIVSIEVDTKKKGYIQ
jgi:hypothetical protein